MNPTCHLDMLGDALAEAGWCTVRRYAEMPPLLRVFSSDLLKVGESIWVKPGVGGVRWFMSSTGQPLAPCHDLAAARAEITAHLTTFTCVPPPATPGPGGCEIS